MSGHTVDWTLAARSKSSRRCVRMRQEAGNQAKYSRHVYIGSVVKRGCHGVEVRVCAAQMREWAWGAGWLDVLRGCRVLHGHLVAGA